MAIATLSQGIAVDPEAPYPVPRTYAWIVFAMTFGLMLSDYLSRQVINAVFPFLKTEWALTDTQLGSLVSVVALTIGVMSIPVSILADRFGRVRSAAAMALVWALATIACGMAESFTSLVIARAFVGLGEAGYGSAGAAILTRVFPARLHATAMGSFLAAGMIGSMLGVVLGGVIAQALGWKVAFLVMGTFGLVLAALFPVLVKEQTDDSASVQTKVPVGQVLGQLVRTPTLLLVALGGACTMFAQTAFIAWLPSYLNRFYGLEPGKASMGTGVLIICISLGMIIGGGLADRFSRRNPLRRLHIVMTYGALMGCALLLAFRFGPGTSQFLLIALGLLVSTGFLGPALAVAADVTPPAAHATAFAILALAYMLLGGAPGPLVVGRLADVMGLDRALSIVPVASLLGGGFFYLASTRYLQDRAKVRGA
ncbi:MFS transporter [Ramlibacter sp. 2FC]|uniref:MFS transporter n=1 Tax=Ramlibacter sp. 2FC TaxID=2502188 RepID=UPI0014857914|nr:MFS transporter [Ramlibacter sp. 2FC]